jgi:hypothetical protein
MRHTRLRSPGTPYSRSWLERVQLRHTAFLAAGSCGPCDHPAISWTPFSVTTTGGAGSTTTPGPIVVTYSACLLGGSWHMRVASGSGTGSIVIGTGGYRDPLTNPPVNQAEAQDAVTKMAGYQARGSVLGWHTQAASLAHEHYHEDNWKCVADREWPGFCDRICTLSVPQSQYPTEQQAIAAMQGSANTMRVQYLQAVIAGLACDTANCPPYCAGQNTLNGAITFVLGLAATNGWTVTGGPTTPCSFSPPC